MNARPSDERTGDASDAPGAEDRELRRRGAGQQIGRGDAVLEVLGGEPLAMLDDQGPEQRDVRGRPAEADHPDATPLARHP